MEDLLLINVNLLSVFVAFSPEKERFTWDAVGLFLNLLHLVIVENILL